MPVKRVDLYLLLPVTLVLVCLVWFGSSSFEIFLFCVGMPDYENDLNTILDRCTIISVLLHINKITLFLEK